MVTVNARDESQTQFRRAVTWLRRPEAVLLIVVLGLGIYFRCWGMLFAETTFGADEASWTRRLLEHSLLKPSIRPLLFMALSRLAAEAFGPFEVVLRFLPWLSGLAVLGVAVALSRRLFTAPAARLVFVATLALHPMLVDYTKIFKPYSMSLLLHTSSLLLALWYVASGKSRALLATLGLLLGGVLLSQDIVFAYPGIYLVLAWSAWRAGKRRHLTTTVAAGFVTVAFLAFLYAVFWRRLDVGHQGGESEYWGRKWGVFHVPGTDSPLPVWVLEKHWALLKWPAQRAEQWGTLGPFDEEHISTLGGLYSTLLALLALAGIVLAVRRRRYAELVLLAGPFVALTLANLTRLWPLGAFRTNQFMLLYAAAFVALTFDWKRRGAFADLGPVLGLLLVPLLLFEREWYSNSESRHFRAFAKDLTRLAGQRTPKSKERIELDWRYCRLWAYYFEIHPTFASEWPVPRRRFTPHCTERPKAPGAAAAARALRSKRRIWAAESDKRSDRMTLPSGVKVVSHAEGGYGVIIAVRRERDEFRYKKGKSRAPR